MTGKQSASTENIRSISEKNKRSDEAIKLTTEGVSQLLRTALDGFYVADMQGRFVDVNEAYCRIIGYTRDELLGMAIQDVEILENEEDVRRHIQKVIEYGTDRFESKHRRKDGQTVDLEISISYLVSGAIIFSFLRDVTERKRAERVLVSRLRISDYALEHTLDELLTKVLDEAEGLTGSRIGFFHFVDDDQTSLTLQAWSTNTLESVCSSEGKGRHYPLDTAGVWADCIRHKKALIHNDYASLPGRRGFPPGHAPVERELVVPIFRNDLIVAVLGVGNKPTAYVNQDVMTLQHLANLAWDIVKRKKAEETLRTSELKYSRLFENMTEAYVCTDMDGQIVESNRAYQELTGYSPEELQTLTYMQLTPEKWHQYEEDIVKEQILARGYSDAYEKEYQRKNGAIINIELRAVLMQDSAGEPAGMWAIIRDITDRKQAELVLNQGREAAETASRAKSEFLATISHEIRTPLGAMLGNLELLEGTPFLPQQQEYLKDCKSASQMLLQIINDVLDLSKIEAGKLELVSEIFSITSMASQLARIYSATARQKGITLTTAFAEGLPAYISGDQQRLQQIISNLLGNAIKFTEQGEVSLEISGKKKHTAAEPHRTELCIVIRDSGIGIPADKLEYIFGTFTQVQQFSTRSTSGSGLGLPICRRLLALMGGSIAVSSEVGTGSVFTILLPVTACVAQAQAQEQAQAQAQAQSPRKILLADDDARGRSVAQKLLQRRGYDVVAVENGAKLLDALQKESFEIVLTDISMPDMEGTEAARIIRSGERPGIDPYIPIIAMTAHAFSDDRERFLVAGINGYASKPVNLEDLFRQIETLCVKREDEMRSEKT